MCSSDLKKTNRAMRAYDDSDAEKFDPSRHLISAPVITLSLLERLRSRDNDSFTDKLLAAMRNQFGGHEIKKE